MSQVRVNELVSLIQGVQKIRTLTRANSIGRLDAFKKHLLSLSNTDMLDLARTIDSTAIAAGVIAQQFVTVESDDQSILGR
jgi:hypothetical protein